MEVVKKMLTNEMIVENRDSQNLSYILKDPQLFFPTGYKVLQSQAKNGFVSCAKVMHNGMNKLVYDISDYKTLDSLLPTFRPETFLAVLTNLMDVVIEFKNNGFIHCTNIETSFNKIFIDCNNYKVYLVYLPIDTLARQDDSSVFEASLKRAISSAIDQFDNLKNPATVQLTTYLDDTACTLERLREILSVTPHAEQEKYRSNTQRSLGMTGSDLTDGEEDSHTPELVALPAQGKNGFLKGFFKNKAKKEKKQGNRELPVDLQSEIEGGATEILGEIFTPGLILSGVKTPVKIDILVTKTEFLIGKKEDAVDGVIAFNNAVSRVHCKIEFESGKYYITDLGSANGTYINGARMLPNQKKPVRIGDKVQLANSAFLLRSV